MRINVTHHLKKSFIMTLGLLACALHQPAMALSLGYLNTVTNLDLSTSSLTDTALNVCSTNSTLTNTVVIGSAQELRINGNVTFSVTNKVQTVANLTVSGTGSFTVSTNGGNFLIGGYPGSSVYTVGTLDMAALDTFTANLGTNGNFSVGAAGSGSYAIPCMLTLATNSTITAKTLSVGTGSLSSGNEILRLGSGINILNVSNFTIGTGRAGGTNSFNTSSGSVIVRGATGAGSLANLTISVGTAGSDPVSAMNLSGHSATLQLDQLKIGAHSGGGTAAHTSTGTLIFDTGTLDVNAVVLGNMMTGTGFNGYCAVGNLILTGGVAVVNSGMIIATNNASVTYTGKARGTLTVGGTASVMVSNTVGAPAITLASMAAGVVAGSIATGTVNVAGGTLKVYGDIVKGANVANTTNVAVLNLTGGALLMPNYAIVNVDNFTMTNAMLAVRVYSGLQAITNSGTGVLAPGGTNVVGSTIISNSYVQASTATLDIDLVSRLSYDRVTVTGTVQLAGTINVRSVPAAAGDFDILTSDVSVSDTSILDAGAIAAGFKKTLVNAGKTVRVYRHPGTFISFL